MAKPDTPRFAGLRNGDLVRPARPRSLKIILGLAALIATVSLLIPLV